MRLHSVTGLDASQSSSSTAPVPNEQDSHSVDATLRAATREYSGPQGPLGPVSESRIDPLSPPAGKAPMEAEASRPLPGKNAAAAYEQQANRLSDPAPMSDFQKYKDDQLLRNPGGKHYYLEKSQVVEHLKDQESFVGRITKDLSDSFENIKNFFHNFFLGSKVLYRDQNNQIQESQQKGLVRTIMSFFKDLGSALSFGFWNPDGKEIPQGFAGRMLYSVSKLKDAFVSDLIEGVPTSVNHMGKNLILAGWNLIEVLPDATIGHFEEGQKLTATVFDNGQVMVEYLTDILPSGDAWLRVHAASLKELQPPFIYNLNMPEHYTGDTRWQLVRNTPLRKTIETIGALLADVVAMGLIGMTGSSSNRNHQIK